MNIRCARNCFQCPICQNTLSVVANQEVPQKEAGSPDATDKPTVHPYHLFCGVSRWDSQEVNITFEKPTSSPPGKTGTTGPRSAASWRSALPRTATLSGSPSPAGRCHAGWTTARRSKSCGSAWTGLPTPTVSGHAGQIREPPTPARGP